MGVAGSGKTTVGQLLAARLGWPFADGDDYHPDANVLKMRNGIPLTDEDRQPWLDRLRALISSWIASGTCGILACSALKRMYRDQLRGSDEVRFVYLKADPELLRQRLLRRAGHYMKSDMLESQWAALEEPVEALTVDASKDPDEIAGTIVASLRMKR